MSDKIGWAITGAGHMIEDIFEIILSLDDVELFLSKAAEEVLKIYKIDPARFPGKIHRDTLASAPVCGKFATGHFKRLVVAPATSNAVAKFVSGVSDTLITNIFAHAGKGRVPITVMPTDVEPVMETVAPGGKKVMVYPRKIDLDNTEKLAGFESVSVVRTIEELRAAVMEKAG